MNNYDLYKRMYLIRKTEELILRGFKNKKLKGTSHCCVGQEAVAVGVCFSLAPADVVFSNHRGHGHMMAMGLEPEKLIYEIAGKDDGQCGGLGGSQHIAAPEIGFMGSNGIVGGAVPIAVGYALGLKRLGKKNKVVVFFGDGASNQGVVHEAMNMAAIWNLPIIFVYEDNMYAMSSPSRKFVAGDMFSRAEAYGIDFYDVVGHDVFDIIKATKSARRENGPSLLDCPTYRFCGHSKSDQRKYRTREEEKAWKKDDPLNLLGRDLDDSIRLAIEAEVDKQLADIEAAL